MDTTDEMIAAAKAGVTVDEYRRREARRAARVAANTEAIERTHRTFAHTITDEEDDDR